MASPFSFTPKNKPLGPMPLISLTAVPEWSPYTRGHMPQKPCVSIVEDGGHVLERVLYDTDLGWYGNPAWEPDTCRNEQWFPSGSAYYEGDTWSAVLGIKLVEGFPNQSPWFTVAQVHLGYNVKNFANPCFSLEVAGNTVKVQNNRWGQVAYSAPMVVGRYYYFGFQCYFHRTNGEIRVWPSLDVLPDITKPAPNKVTTPTWPTDETTTDGKAMAPAYSKQGMYRDKTQRLGVKHVTRTDNYTESPLGIQDAMTRYKLGCRAAALGDVTPPPPPVGTTLDALNEEWAEFMKPTYVNYQGVEKETVAEKWRKSNPTEWGLLEVYRASGPTEQEPTLATSLGKQMVQHVQAWRREQGI